MILKKLFLLALLVLTTPPCTLWAAGEAVPVEVTADKAFEWHKAKGYVVARGNAVITKGADTLKADQITAYMQQGSESKIDHVLAEGNVILTSSDNAAYGAHATYDLNTEIAVLTGGDLKLVSPDQTVTAQNQITYNRKAETLEAIGNAVAVRGTNTIAADKLVAHFTKTADGKSKLSTLEALGNMRLTTPSEVLTAARGKYEAATNKAYAWQNVKIVRGQNTIEGDRAESDLTSKISNVYADSKNGSTPKRVHGVFYSD